VGLFFFIFSLFSLLLSSPHFDITLLQNPILLWFCVWIYTQGLALARQVLYHLSHAPSPFCFIIESQVFSPDWHQTVIFLSPPPE
jgi:hypothetical protein